MELNKKLGLKPGKPPQGVPLAIRAFNMLGFASLEQAADVLGYEDMELLVTQIETIRAFQTRGQN